MNLCAPCVQLPEFPYQDVCWSKDEIITRLAQTGTTTILRSAQLHPKTLASLGLPLGEALKQIDDYFTEIATHAGPMVVQHEFGLTKGPQGAESRLGHTSRSLEATVSWRT